MSLRYVLIRDEKAQNTHGGTFTSGAWQTRTLNNKVEDAGGLASLAGNQVTLQPGAYLCSISCSAFLVQRHQARLFDITGAAVLLLGSSELGGTDQTRSRIEGRFVLTVPSALEVQHQCVLTKADDGFGRASNLAAEIYTIAEFFKLQE